MGSIPMEQDRSTRSMTVNKPKTTGASKAFQVFVKPAGARCNLGCDYCYYLSKNDLYPQATLQRMPEDLLEAYIVQQMEAAPDSTGNFFWHGGEPTLLGLDYFRRITELQRKHQRPDMKITNGIQTNGLFIDEDWCRFFAAEGFSVGISIDGPPALHDAYRLTRDRKTTHRQVMQGYRLLLRYGVPVDILCVVHDRNVREPAAVYQFFREIKAQYISFIPLVEPDITAPNGVGPRTVPSEAFGTFLCAVFDAWVRQDIGRIVVQIFEEAARPFSGQDHSLCVFRETCGDVPVIEHNGDFYCCDHFVTPEYRLGNIRGTALAALLEHPAQQSFGRNKRDKLPQDCRECDVLAMCHGGCPKDRIILAPHGEGSRNYLCAGYQKFFRHCRPYFFDLATLRMSGQPPERLMEHVRNTDLKARPVVGRNDPCPCGSGKKYKRCCFLTL